MRIGPIAKRLARKLGLERGTPGSSERAAGYYDDAYAASEEYRLPYPRSRYYFAWTVIVDRVRRSGLNRVLEIGCGPGQLAEFLVDQGVRRYVGFDFSRVAIDMARAKNLPGARFEVDDARTSSLYEEAAGAYLVCTEVLEHVEEDVTILDRIPPGTPCVCTVPSFPYESHVRHFETADAVRRRYGAHFDGFDVLALARPDADGRYYVFGGTRNGHRVTPRR